jgi:hypothetical protein
VAVVARSPDRTTLRRAAALAVAALAVAGAGCGGGSGGSETTATEAWANGVCSAFADWKATLEGVKSDLSDTSSLSKDSLTKAADTVQAANKTLSDDLSSLDRPQTEAGKQAADTLDTLEGQLQAGFDSIQTSLAGGVTLATMSTAATTLSTMASQLQAAFDSLQQAGAQNEVSQAFESSPACEPFTEKK